MLMMKLKPQGKAYRIKLPWASFFLKLSIMIDDRWLQKQWSSSEIYSIRSSFCHELHHQHRLMMFSSFFSFVLFRHVHVRTSVGTAIMTKKQDKSLNILERKWIRKNQMCTKITLPNRTHNKIIHTYTLRAPFYF